jgi:hypothetical protein
MGIVFDGVNFLRILKIKLARLNKGATKNWLGFLKAMPKKGKTQNFR